MLGALGILIISFLLGDVEIRRFWSVKIFFCDIVSVGFKGLIGNFGLIVYFGGCDI